ncbi:hypothetical protein CHELA1G11_11123 [Hyphomicrobiales bacterium]|nr:hypothetical protein CHELA1G11_11123 [Hyphomicrobiales bacterium]CAH1669970.1 hypothetical protein CHELA1G2_13186 [Hyphomicrobiales bacterium]
MTAAAASTVVSAVAAISLDMLDIAIWKPGGQVDTRCLIVIGVFSGIGSYRSIENTDRSFFHISKL